MLLIRNQNCDADTDDDNDGDMTLTCLLCFTGNTKRRKKYAAVIISDLVSVITGLITQAIIIRGASENYISKYFPKSYIKDCYLINVFS